jgi:hypothetical protein
MDHQVFAQLLGNYGEFFGSIAVFITLAYLSIQIRSSNKQAELESFRHNWDGLNRWCDSLSQSTERASIINRGRQSLDSLTEDERLVFLHIHLRLMNTLESWFHQITSTSPPGEYRNQQIENIGDLVQFYLDYPGTHEMWSEVRHTFVPIQQLNDSRISYSK